MSMKDFVNTLNDEQRKALLEALAVTDDDSPEIVEEEKEPEPYDMNKEFHQFVMNKQKELDKAKKKPVQAKENTWQDTGENRDIETPKIEITPRKRKPPETKTLVCKVCGAMEKVNAAFVSGQFYRCNRCVGK